MKPAHSTRSGVPTGRIVKCLAVLGISTLVTLGAVAPAQAVAADPSESLAQFLQAGTLDLTAAELANSSSSSPTGPTTDVQAFDAAVFGALADQVALLANNHGRVPLVIDPSTSTGLVAVAQSGITSYSSSPDTSTSSASTGAIDPATGGFTDASSGGSTVNLGAAFDALGVDTITREILDRVDLEVGTVASRASAEVYSDVVREYRLGGLALDLRSPLLATLPGLVNSALQDATLVAEQALEALLPGGDLPLPAGTIPDATIPRAGTIEFGEASLIVNPPNFDDVVEDVLSDGGGILTSDNGLATVDLETGDIRIDLAVLFGGDVNGQAANTDVFTTANMTAISAAVANALGKTTGLFATGILEALKATQLGMSIAYDLRVASPSSAWPNLAGMIIAHGELSGAGTLTQLAEGGGLFTSELVQASGLPTCVKGSTCTGLNFFNRTDIVVPAAIGLADGALPLVAGGLVAVVFTPAIAALDEVETLLAAEVTPIVTEIYGKITGAFTGLMPALARVVINEQPTVGDLGAGSATVRALGLTVLPKLSLSSKTHIGLASSTVIVVADPTLAIIEPIVEPGGALTVVGDGWNPNADADAVELVFTGSDNAPIGDPVAAEVDADGAITAQWTIPEGAFVGTLTVTAVQGDRERVATTSVVDPTLSIRGAKPEPGAMLSIDGLGWSPAPTGAVAARAAAAPGQVTLTFTDAKGNPLGDPTDAEVEEDGSIRAAWTIPAAAPVGTLTVTAVQGEIRRTASTVVVNPPIPGVLPATGLDAAWTIGIALGVSLLIAGGAFAAIRRRNG